MFSNLSTARKYFMLKNTASEGEPVQLQLIESGKFFASHLHAQRNYYHCIQITDRG